MAFDTEFPDILRELLEHEFEYREDGGIDFEPYEAFQDAAENADWIRAWTGNQELDAAEYRFFGADGTGGMAGFWLVREGADLLDQPIVFFGSEGEVGMVAYDFADFCWLLADGVGPLEAVEYGADDPTPEDAFVEFATKHVPDAKKSGADVLKRANEAFPTFQDDFMKLCQYD